MTGVGTSKSAKKESDKKKKSKPPGDGGHRSEAPSVASQRASVDKLPENFCFLWSIDAIETEVNQAPRILGVGNKNNDIAKLWFPPIRTNGFRRNWKGNLYRWKKGGSEILRNANYPKSKLEVASIFFQAKQDNFVACYEDCTRQDIADLERGWSHIGFDHPGNGLSEVKLSYKAERYLLAAPAKNSSWMPQVLPEVYNYETKGTRSPPYEGPPGGLCGNLALIIGMAAFSADMYEAEEVVAHNFKFGEWKFHNTEIGIGRYEGRGVVVSIYLDPEAADTKKSHLINFEKGCYGPIFVTHMTNQEIPRSSSVTAYTHYGTGVPTTAYNLTPRPGSSAPLSYSYTASSVTTSPPLSLLRTLNTASFETKEEDKTSEE